MRKTKHCFVIRLRLCFRRICLDRSLSSMRWCAGSKRSCFQISLFIFNMFYTVCVIHSALHAARDGVWQSVAGTRYRFFVFSAYVERRTVAAVRVIAATKTRGADPVFCRLWLPDNRTLTLKARVQTIREHQNLEYSAAFVLCLLNSTDIKPRETVGAAVTVMASAAPARAHTNLLTVLDTEPGSGIEETVHICVKPFHFTYSSFDWMIEWFEFQRLLGVSHFYMYNSSLGLATSCVLDHYKRLNLVTMLPWKLPFVSKAEIRTEGLFAAFNDCLYRSMRTAGWLLVVDVDEVVIPKRKQTLPDMLSVFLSSSKQIMSRIPGAFLFRNAFFYVLWEDDSKAPEPLITARKTRRWNTPHAFKSRSKYAVRPRHAVELGNHFLWEHARNATSVGVGKHRALLHHYRGSCEYDGGECLSIPSIVDRSAHKWSAELMQRVTAERAVLARACLARTDDLAAKDRARAAEVRAHSNHTKLIRLPEN